MTTPAEIEAALFAMPPDERDELLENMRQRHADEMGYVPHLTPEQVAMIRRRAEEVDRGEVELLTIEESTSGLSEAIRRVGAGEDPDTVLAELRDRRTELKNRRTAEVPKRELVDAA